MEKEVVAGLPYMVGFYQTAALYLTYNWKEGTKLLRAAVGRFTFITKILTQKNYQKGNREANTER